jgi:hypothetical protein
MRRYSGLPPFQTSSDNISLDRDDEGFADARIVDISAAQTMNRRTYPLGGSFSEFFCQISSEY